MSYRSVCFCWRMMKVKCSIDTNYNRSFLQNKVLLVVIEVINQKKLKKDTPSIESCNLHL